MSQENVEIVRGLYEALARRNGAAPFEVYAEDIVWDVSNWRRGTLMDSMSYHGHEGVRQFFGESFSVWGTVDLDVEELIDAGDRVVAVIRDRAIGRTSGAPVSTRHVAVFTLAHGKVIRVQVFDDREQAIKAVGLEE